MSLVPFFDDAERDVGQQRGQDTALRRAAIAAHELCLRHGSGFQECLDQPRELRVDDAPSHPDHQRVMIDAVEAGLDVAFDPSIAHWKGSFSALFQRLLPRGFISALRCAMAPWTDRPGLKPYETG